MLLYNHFYLDLQDECLLGVKILYEAFALTGRIVDCECTQGAALGYELLGLQPVLEPPAMSYFMLDLSSIVRIAR